LLNPLSGGRYIPPPRYLLLELQANLQCFIGCNFPFIVRHSSNEDIEVVFGFAKAIWGIPPMLLTNVMLIGAKNNYKIYPHLEKNHLSYGPSNI